jgi:hypothetical protein
VLERAVGLVLGMAGQVNLPITPNDVSRAVHEDGRVEAARAPILDGQLGIAEAEPDGEPPRLVEERARLRPRHLALEEGVDLRLILHPPAREERGERQLGEHDQLAAARVRLREEGEETLDDVGAGFAAMGPSWAAPRVSRRAMAGGSLARPAALLKRDRNVYANRERRGTQIRRRRRLPPDGARGAR